MNNDTMKSNLAEGRGEDSQHKLAVFSIVTLAHFRGLAKCFREILSIRRHVYSVTRRVFMSSSKKQEAFKVLFFFAIHIMSGGA
jgi:pheromone shutdown protein TraB